MTKKKFIIRGIHVYYIHLIFSFVYTLILTPIILKYLGKAEYGIWAIFNSVVAYFMLFDLGMTNSVAKYTSEYRAIGQEKKLSSLISSILTIFLFISALVVIVTIGLTPFIARIFNISQDLIGKAQVTFFIMGLNIALLLIGGVFGNIIYGMQRVDVWKAFSIVNLLVNAALTILFLRLGFGLVGVAIATIFGTIVLISLYLIFLRCSKAKLFIHPGLVKTKLIKEVAPYSLRTFVLGVTCRGCYFTSNIIIGLFLGVSAVAPYEVAFKVCFLPTFLFSVISTTFFPHFSRLYALKDINSLRGLYLKLTKISLAIIAPVILFLIFWGRSFINLWVGKENFVGMSAFMVLVAMDFFHALGTSSVMLLQSIGKNRALMYSELANVVLNLSLSILLIRQIGILGIPLGMLLANLFTSFWVVTLKACQYANLTIKEYVLTSVLPPSLACIITVAIILIVKNNLFPPSNIVYLAINGVIVTIFYIVIFLIVASTKEERSSYKQIFVVK